MRERETFEVVDLPPAGREDMLRRCRMPGQIRPTMKRAQRRRAAPDAPAYRPPAQATDYTDHEVGARPRMAGVHDSWIDDGASHSTDDPDVMPHEATVASSTPEASNLGAHIVRVGTHRGILHPDEFVDEVTLTPLLEKKLGFTMSQINRAWPPGSRGGRPPSQVRELRDRISVRLAEVADRGGNMVELGSRLGWSVRRSTGGRVCDRMTAALARGRQVRNAGRSMQR